MDNVNEYIKVKSKPKYLVFLCVYYFLYPICYILYGRKNNWLICERGDDAQDNAFIFYSYLKDKYPKINATYLIKRSSSSFNRLITYGKVVEYGSLKHFLMMIGYPVKISDHLFGYSPWIQSTIYYRKHKTKHKHIFIQHGITKNDVPSFYYKACSSINLFVCGAEPEYEYISNRFGYPSGIVKYLGFARFDNLANHSSNKHILIMPTWRRYLLNLTTDGFRATDFYKKWSLLLTNKELVVNCKRKNIKIDFYLHHELQRYSDSFASNDVVSVIRYSKKTVQELLKESSLLVTDFSSVFFDFAYMEKPVIYFQFDEEKYSKEHYAKGYYDYRIDGFGPVTINVTECISEINKIINTNFDMNNYYLSRAERFFPLRDSNNCKRLFEAITKLLK